MKYEVAETKQKTVYTRILTITINHLFFKPSINFGLGIGVGYGIAPPQDKDLC